MRKILYGTPGHLFRRSILTALLIIFFHQGSKAQFIIGTTGLLHLPTADMQRDKTAMIGGSWLSSHATPDTWYYATWNYYLNITILPFLEVSYDMTVFKGSHLFRSFPPSYRRFYKYWANQDRNFSIRVRAIKEGQFFPWMPQIVVGGNDVLHTFSGDKGKLSITDAGNGYWGRLYIAATRHFEFQGMGNLGAHLAFIHSNRSDFHTGGLGFGANFRLALNGDNLATTLANGLDLMAEYDTHTINAGISYHAWKDHINLYTEFNRLKYFSGGVQFRLYLK